MKDDSMKIEQRLQNMKNFYVKAGDLIDKLPDAIPEKTREKLKNAILGDTELKKLMDQCFRILRCPEYRRFPLKPGHRPCTYKFGLSQYSYEHHSRLRHNSHKAH